MQENRDDDKLIQSVQFSCSFVSNSATAWTAACQASLSITNSQSPPKPMSTESVMPSNHLILCHPLLLLPSLFPSIRVFSSESALCIRWPKYWSFSISPSHEYSGLTCFRMNWLDLLRLLLFWLPAQLIGSQLSENEGKQAKMAGRTTSSVSEMPHTLCLFSRKIGVCKIFLIYSFLPDIFISSSSSIFLLG